MAWVRTLDENEATGGLLERYQADLNQLGFVMEATKALSANPDLALAVDAFEAAVKKTSHLSARERRLIHLLIADRVRSAYCVLVYAIPLARDLGGPEGIKAFLRDYRSIPALSEREVAILDYAVAAAVGHSTEALITRLREVGLEDAAIVDVAVTANLRLFGSRVYDALGIEADPFFLEQTDLMEVVGQGAKQPA